MPFVNGKRVSVATWRALQPKPTPMPDLSEDEVDRALTVSTASPEKHVRTPSKAAQAKAAIAAATGANAESLDEKPEPVLVAIDLDDDLPGGVIGALEFTPGAAVADVSDLDAD